MAASLCPGIEVRVAVGCGEGVKDALRVRVASAGKSVGVNATAVCVPWIFAAAAVSAITVGKYSGG